MIEVICRLAAKRPSIPVSQTSVVHALHVDCQKIADNQILRWRLIPQSRRGAKIESTPISFDPSRFIIDGAIDKCLGNLMKRVTIIAVVKEVGEIATVCLKECYMVDGIP
jgi:hypothetical protein